MKDTAYYDKESIQYSEKRYPEISTQYTHFFFKRRLTLLLDLLAQVVGAKETSLLEVGCADGVVLSTIAKKFDRLEKLIGIDISPEMINVARAHYGSDTRARYYVRGESDLQDKMFDVVVEVGVLNLTDLRSDLAFARDHLKEGGHYIASLAATTSLVARLKPSKEDYRHCMAFAEYERILSEYFTIEQRIPYGLFIPHLWKVPAFARRVQPVVESAFRRLVPHLYHEKIYLLRK